MTRWSKLNLQNQFKSKEYRSKLFENIKRLPEEQNVNNKWEGIKQAINEAANEVIGNKKTHQGMNGGMKSVEILLKKKMRLE